VNKELMKARRSDEKGKDKRGNGGGADWKQQRNGGERRGREARGGGGGEGNRKAVRSKKKAIRKGI
jgi:hypothetical protein